MIGTLGEVLAPSLSWQLVQPVTIVFTSAAHAPLATEIESMAPSKLAFPIDRAIALLS